MGWDVESHTYNLHGPHARMLLRATPGQLAADLDQEDALIASEVGRAPVAFAYPGGHAPPWAVEAVRTRYAGAFVGGDVPVVVGADPMLLPRYGVTAGTDVAGLLAAVFGRGG